MRWDPEKKDHPEAQWHRWFAWYPVRIDEGINKGKEVWLETVLRKGKWGCGLDGCYWRYEYKL